MMEAICHAVRQAFYKCVLRREQVKKLLSIAVACNKSRHLGSELVGMTHHCQKLALLLGQRIYHGGNKHGVYVRIAVGSEPRSESVRRLRYTAENQPSLEYSRLSICSSESSVPQRCA